MVSLVFSKKYLIINEILNAVTHGIGVILSIIGMVFLIIKGIHINSVEHIVAYSIYGISLILLFLASTLFHSLIFTKAKKFLQLMDHSSIYLLIAGTYTPYCLLTIKGKLGWALFVIIWVMAGLGILYKSLFLAKKGNSAVFIYILMGWLCLVAVKPLYQGLGLTGTLLLVLGGIAYTVGALFYQMKSVKFMHVVWHLFVLLGAGFMYFSVFLET
ncbi:PAQR family membrane homeostasis protein TrhA [Vagococcus intermedius]|uniref:Hemolysin III family protein n=1 Tax=Vagococcus intermedius TaxID=2991418 RepID=A0AAF0CWS8_9ENTE|nr:hemolysin III family protein [Vagococcus intermedius]WEG74314.1 hemolysin III family protein [Vagococcus intermedius]WEG76364.1 hemolysin III family protein [Vagococcus intermedius]